MRLRNSRCLHTCFSPDLVSVSTTGSSSQHHCVDCLAVGRWEEHVVCVPSYDWGACEVQSECMWNGCEVVIVCMECVEVYLQCMPSGVAVYMFEGFGQSSCQIST